MLSRCQSPLQAHQPPCMIAPVCLYICYASPYNSSSVHCLTPLHCVCFSTGGLLRFEVSILPFSECRIMIICVVVASLRRPEPVSFNLSRWRMVYGHYLCEDMTRPDMNAFTSVFPHACGYLMMLMTSSQQDSNAFGTYSANTNTTTLAAMNPQ